MTNLGINAIDYIVEQHIMDLAQIPSGPNGDSFMYMEYLAAAERAVGRPARYFDPLRTVASASNFTTWPSDILPFLLVVNTGLAEPPKRKGDGMWDASWMLACAIIVTAPDRQATREALFVHAAAFRKMLLSNKTLRHPEHIGGLSWVDSRPFPLRADDERSLGGIQQLFKIDTPNVVDERSKIPHFPVPRDDPYEEFTDEGNEVLTVHQTINIKAQEGE